MHQTTHSIHVKNKDTAVVSDGKGEPMEVPTDLVVSFVLDVLKPFTAGKVITNDIRKEIGRVEYNITRVSKPNVVDLVRIEAVTMDMPFHTSGVTLPLELLVRFLSGRPADETMFILSRWQMQLLGRALRWVGTRNGGVGTLAFLRSHVVESTGIEDKEVVDLVERLEDAVFLEGYGRRREARAGAPTDAQVAAGARQLLDEYDQGLLYRKHGGVAAGHLVDGLRKLLNLPGFERMREKPSDG